MTRSNRAPAGSGTEFGGLLGAAGAAAAGGGALGECTPVGSWQQWVRAGCVVCGRGLCSFPRIPHPPTPSQDPVLRRRCFTARWVKRRLGRTSPLPQARQLRSVQGSSGAAALPAPTPPHPHMLIAVTETLSVCLLQPRTTDK